ncbi:MAG: WbuC family cupin fold metalloprotein [Holosporales bacterium]|nr:WbuC family cupin fold metalloprotein [Holosporales bacterium]
MPFEKIKDEVYAATGLHPVMTKKDIEYIQDKAEASLLKKCRILMHGFPPDSILHVMLVVLKNSSYTPPHMHKEPEYNYILEGRLGVFHFNQVGDLKDSIVLGPKESEFPCLIRLDPGYFHLEISLTPSVTFLEMQVGPHTQTQFATWAPPAPISAENRLIVGQYLNELCQRAGFSFEGFKNDDI